MRQTSRDMPVRRLPECGASLEVVLIRADSAGADVEEACRLEQRQDFHTLFWTRRGSGKQFIDGTALELAPPMLTVVGRGQAYRFEHMSQIDGAVLSFSDD